tara:strand:- start:6511 stop:7299 length:789 start_codon:yes stop_codon:yes gene_type:complete
MTLSTEIRRLWIALGYFTRVPVPALEHWSDTELSRAARYFPLVGSLVGLLSAMVLMLACQFWPPGVAVLLSMTFSLLLTGAFHEDGLADSADGFGGGLDRKRVLEIMKDSRIGTYGAAALLIALLLKFSLLSAIATASVSLAMAALFLAHTVSRAGALSVMLRLDYVRMDDSARAKPVAQSMGLVEWQVGAATGAIALLLAWALSSISLPAVIALLGVVAASTLACIAYFRKRIGGYTGDCLGATQQIVEISIYLALCASLT